MYVVFSEQMRHSIQSWVCMDIYTSTGIFALLHIEEPCLCQSWKQCTILMSLTSVWEKSYFSSILREILYICWAFQYILRIVQSKIVRIQDKSKRRARSLKHREILACGNHFSEIPWCPKSDWYYLQCWYWDQIKLNPQIHINICQSSKQGARAINKKWG